MLDRYPEVELIRQEYLPPSQETVISSGSIRTDKLPSEGAGPPVRARQTISPSLNSSTEKNKLFQLIICFISENPAGRMGVHKGNQVTFPVGQGHLKLISMGGHGVREELF